MAQSRSPVPARLISGCHRFRTVISTRSSMNRHDYSAVGPVREGLEATAGHREIAAFQRHRWRGRQIVCRAQTPSPTLGDECMIAGVIVRVGDCGVEAHPAEQLAQVVFGSGTCATDLVSEQETGPVPTIFQTAKSRQRLVRFGNRTMNRQQTEVIAIFEYDPELRLQIDQHQFDIAVVK